MPSTTRSSSIACSVATATSARPSSRRSLTQWHVEPTNPRTFDIELAKQKLDAAGYKLDANGKRLDKEGKPINLRMFMPDSDDELPEGGAVHRRTGTASSGSSVTTQVETRATLGDLHPAARGR